MHRRSNMIRPRVSRSAVAAALTCLAAVSASPASADTVYRVHPRDPSAYRAGKSAAMQAYLAFAHRDGVRSFQRGARPESLVAGLNEPGLDATVDKPGLTPPDTTGAIGPDHYLEFVNSEIAVYDRGSLADPIARVHENTFVGTADDTCDGQIQWDQEGRRWLYAVLDCGAQGGNQALFYGWSTSADPTNLASGWCRYRYSTGSSLEDYPKLGHDDSQIIIGTNTFDSNGQFNGSHMFIFDKPAPGDTACPLTSDENAGGVVAGAAATDFTPVPASLADSSATGYVVSTDSHATGSHLTVYEIGRTAGGANTVLGTQTTVTVPSFSVPAPIPQPGTGEVIDSSDARLTQAVAVTDPGTGKEGIWTQHTVAGAGGGPSVVRWYQLAPGATAPLQTGTVSGPSGTFAFNAAISPTSDGSSAVVFYNTGGAGQLVDLQAQYRVAGMALGQTTSAVALAQSSYADVDFSCGGTAAPCRWGDYAGASPDPTNSALVWGTGELTTLAPDAGGDAQWGTQNVALYTMPPPLVKTSAATSVTANAATVSGTVNPNGYLATYHFEYGTTVAYGTATADAGAGSDSSEKPVSAGLTGLMPSTIYHYALVASNAYGTTTTPDQTFTTTGPPAPSATISSPAQGGVYLIGQVVPTSFGCTEGPGGPGLATCTDSNGASRPVGRLNTSYAGAHLYWVTAISSDNLGATARLSYTVRPRMAISILTNRSQVSHRAAMVKLSCTGGLPGTACRGSLTLTTRVRHQVRRRSGGRVRTVSVSSTVTIAHASYTLSVDQRQPLALSLSRKALALLSRASAHRLSVLASASLPGQRARTRTITLVQ